MEGVCFGAALMGIQAFLAGDLAHFDARVERLSQLIYPYGIMSLFREKITSSQEHLSAAAQVIDKDPDVFILDVLARPKIQTKTRDLVLRKT